MIELVVLRRAESDIQRIYTRLEDFQTGKGEEFLRRVDFALQRLQQFPELGTPYHSSYRRLLLGQLPFGIFYRVEGNRLIIVTTAALRQDPTTIRAILDDPSR
jgi:toxin ParE1/3/4